MWSILKCFEGQSDSTARRAFVFYVADPGSNDDPPLYVAQKSNEKNCKTLWVYLNF